MVKKITHLEDMLAIRLTLILMFTTYVGCSDTGNKHYEGNWVVELHSENSESQEFKSTFLRYPKKLIIKMSDGIPKVTFEDHYGILRKSEYAGFKSDQLIFWTEGETKENVGLYPIHRLRIIDGKLIGWVYQNELAFRYVGEKTE